MAILDAGYRKRREADVGKSKLAIIFSSADWSSEKSQEKSPFTYSLL